MQNVEKRALTGTEMYNQAVAAGQPAVNQMHGENILSALGMGAGVGAGGMALYHLLRGLKSRGAKEKRYQNYGSDTPIVAQQKVGNDILGTIVNEVGAIPGKITNSLPESLKSVFQSVAPPAKADPNMLSGALATALTAGAGLGGLYGGGKLVNSLMEAKQKRDAKDDVEEARQRYYAILSGADKAAESLNAAYDRLQNKQADALDSIQSGLSTVGTAVFDTLPRGLTTTGLLASLAAGGLGAKFMYDRTAERTRGENAARAQASRARMKPLPTMWIDPEQLARAKQLAEQGNNE
jgi:hypothetical protein